MTIVVDAGHSSSDRGGESLGTPEYKLALTYALELGRKLSALGVTVVQTRTTDVPVPLEKRAALANVARAALFVSIHANSSGNPQARGPWTIHAKGATRAKEIAGRIQATLADILGGSPTAVHSDASPSVGYTDAAKAAIEAGGKKGLSPIKALVKAGITDPYRTLAVLRQTSMPAVLIELGFMTNVQDLKALENPDTCEEVCIALARAIVAEMGGNAVPPVLHLDVPDIEPKMTQPTPALRLDVIEVPTRAHVDEVMRVRRVFPGAAEAAIAAVEVLARGAINGERATLKDFADVLADWLKAQLPPAA